MDKPSGAPNTAAKVKTPSRTQSPTDTPTPVSLDFVAPARSQKLRAADECACDYRNKKNSEARINPIKRQIEHRRMLAPQEADVVERARQRPRKNAADHCRARDCDIAFGVVRQKPIDEIEADLLFVANQKC